jgi:hypothetical protein
MEQGQGAFSIAGMSVGVLGEALERMPSVLGSGMVAYGLVFVADTAATLALVPMPGLLARVAALVLWLLTLVASGIVIASVAVPLHRLTLGGEASPQGIHLFHSRTLRFAWWLIAFELVWAAGVVCAIALVVTAGAPVAARFGGASALIVGLTFVTTRLSVVFPGLAMDVDYPSAVGRLRHAWAISRGRLWTIVGSSIVALFPLVLAVGVVMLLAGGLSVAFGARPGGGHALLSLPFWIGLIGSCVIHVFGAALGAATLSFNYRFGGGPHAEQTAETFA